MSPLLGLTKEHFTNVSFSFFNYTVGVKITFQNYVHRSIIHNSLKVETYLNVINSRMEKTESLISQELLSHPQALGLLAILAAATVGEMDFGVQSLTS